jgi:hypothetical protein
MAGTGHHTQLLLIEIGFHELFAWAGFELQSFQSQLWSS